MMKTIKYWQSGVSCIQNKDILYHISPLCKRGGLYEGLEDGIEPDTKLCPNCKRKYIKQYGEDALFAELL